MVGIVNIVRKLTRLGKNLALGFSRRDQNEENIDNI